MESVDETVQELDATLEEIKGVLQLIIEQDSVAEKKKTEQASRPALQLAKKLLSELRAEIRRMNDPATKLEYEGILKDRDTKMRNYVMAIKENIFPQRSPTAYSDRPSGPQTYGERKAAEILGEGGPRGENFKTSEQVLEAGVRMQNDALEALERAERVQYVTEQSGLQTLEQLRIQTERLYQVDEELEDIHGQLDHASRDVKWFFRQLAGDKCLLSLFGIFMLGVLVMLFVIIYKRRK